MRITYALILIFEGLGGAGRMWNNTLAYAHAMAKPWHGIPGGMAMDTILFVYLRYRALSNLKQKHVAQAQVCAFNMLIRIRKHSSARCESGIALLRVVTLLIAAVSTILAG